MFDSSEFVLFCLAGIAIFVAYIAVQVGIFASSMNKMLKDIVELLQKLKEKC